MVSWGGPSTSRKDCGTCYCQPYRLVLNLQPSSLTTYQIRVLDVALSYVILYWDFIFLVIQASAVLRKKNHTTCLDHKGQKQSCISHSTGLGSYWIHFHTWGQVDCCVVGALPLRPDSALPLGMVLALASSVKRGSLV